MAKQILNQGRRWYVLHTYSGYEENVSQNLKQRIESMDMEDKIFNILIPTEKKIKIKNGKRKIVEEKIFPGYVLVEMIVTDDSWYVVRNTPNVTGFIGTGTVPTPITEAEIKDLQKRMGVEEPKFKIDVSANSPVRIIDGPFKNLEGRVTDIDEAKGKIKVSVSMFSRETPIELDFLQIKKIWYNPNDTNDMQMTLRWLQNYFANINSRHSHYSHKLALCLGCSRIPCLQGKNYFEN